MPAQWIDGKSIAQKIRTGIAADVIALKKDQGIVPGLAVVLVGNNEASKVYVRNKEAACRQAGFHAEQHDLPESTTEAELLRLIRKLNRDSKIHGILVQLPLPKQINEPGILEEIDPKKDADGFHPLNMGYLLMGKPTVIPCTPLGIIKLLEAIGYTLEGKEAIVVGRSNIVGKPTALLLMQQNATVTIAHSRTKYLSDKIGSADVVIAALGKPNLIKGEWIKKGAVVIDVGINRNKEGKLTGDVEFEKAAERAAHITPVPGGVGPMTIAMLLWNTLQAAKNISGAVIL